MSSLWTPGGEHSVSREEAAPVASAPQGRPPADGDASGDRTGGDEAAVRAELAELERELLETPAADVVANHCYGLFQLGALHLGSVPPDLVEAAIAIDALAGIVEKLGERLGQAAPTLADGLAQIRLAYVQIAAAGRAASGEDGADASAGEVNGSPGDPSGA